MNREDIKRIIDEAIGCNVTIVEPTLEKNEYYAYTEVWAMPIEQFNQIRSELKVTAISVDGGKIMLTIKAQ